MTSATTTQTSSLRSPEAFLAECLRRGIKLTAQGDIIKATGKPPANPEKFAAFLKAKKPEVLALLSEPEKRHEKARKGPIAQSEKSADLRQEKMTFLALSSSESVGKQENRDMDRTPWERLFEVVATGLSFGAGSGRIAYSWPTHTQDGTLYEPVRVAQGVTTDEPVRWFILAWGRYCGLLCLVGNEQLEESQPARHACAVQDLQILFNEMVGVLDQAEFDSKEKES